MRLAIVIVCFVFAKIRIFFDMTNKNVLFFVKLFFCFRNAEFVGNFSEFFVGHF